MLKRLCIATSFSTILGILAGKCDYGLTGNLDHAQLESRLSSLTILLGNILPTLCIFKNPTSKFMYILMIPVWICYVYYSRTIAWQFYKYGYDETSTFFDDTRWQLSLLVGSKPKNLDGTDRDIRREMRDLIVTYKGNSFFP